MFVSLVHAAPPRGCGLRVENAEYSRFRMTQGDWAVRPADRDLGCLCYKIVGTPWYGPPEVQPGERWAPGYTERR